MNNSIKILFVCVCIVLLSGCARGAEPPTFRDAMGWNIEAKTVDEKNYAYVESVDPTSVAALAGVQVGDLIDISEYEVFTVSDTGSVISNEQPTAEEQLKEFIIDVCERSGSYSADGNNAMNFNVLRAGETMSISIKNVPSMSCG